MLQYLLLQYNTQDIDILHIVTSLLVIKFLELVAKKPYLMQTLRLALTYIINFYKIDYSYVFIT